MFKIFSKDGEMCRYITFISVCGYTSYYRYVDLKHAFHSTWDQIYTQELDNICKGAVIYV